MKKLSRNKRHLKFLLSKKHAKLKKRLERIKNDFIRMVYESMVKGDY
jgi:hypothetical protein